MKLYLLRHAETDWNKEGRLQGKKDIPMNAKGIQQIEKVALQIRNMALSFDQIICSPLCRAKESANIVANIIGCSMNDIILEPLFVERSIGNAEGLIYSEIQGKTRDCETFSVNSISISGLL